MTESDAGGRTITMGDDAYFDVDLIEVEDLINNATELLNEVFSNRPMPVPITDALSPRENAMQEVQRFLSSIREPESPQDDDVVFVEARPGNALPSNARTTAIVDLCTPVDDDPEPPSTRRRTRRSIQSTLAPQALFQDNTPAKTRRRQPKREPGSAAPPKISASSSDEAISPPKKGSLPNLTCSVCLESVLNKRPSSTSCGHIFCQSCILQAIRLTKKCPLCNSRLNRNQVHRVYF